MSFFANFESFVEIQEDLFHQIRLSKKMPINSPQKIQSWLKMMSNAFANQSAKVIKVGKMCFPFTNYIEFTRP